MVPWKMCGTSLVPPDEQKNWHIDAIAYRPEQIRNGEITRLIINLPPRYLKSILVSVAFPAFLLGHDARRRIFAISYGGELAEKHAADSRGSCNRLGILMHFPTCGSHAVPLMR
jgi:hypothetical protein